MPKVKKYSSEQLMHRIGALIYSQNVVFVCSAVINVLHPLLVQVANKSPHIAANVVIALRSLCDEIEKIVNPAVTSDAAPLQPAEKVEG